MGALWNVPCDKSTEMAQLQAFASRNKCHLSDLNLYPASFNLRTKAECNRMVAYLATARGMGQSWIMKPTEGYMASGEGMRVFLASSKAPLSPARLQQEFCGKHIMAQRYIDNPLLLNGRFKFDFRVWVTLARADPWLLYYRDGFIRRSPDNFTADRGDTGAHITNAAAAESTLGSAEFSPYNHHWSFQVNLTFQYIYVYIYVCNIYI